MLRVRHCADSALSIELDEHISRQCSAVVLALDAAIERAAPEGVIETVVGYCSLTIHYDARRTSAHELRSVIEALDFKPASSRKLPGQRWSLPVCYERPYAPDLAAVAQDLGKSEADIVELHSTPIYFCYLLGFLPGFAYLGDLPEALILPRRAVPRTRVPAGSVAIADSMTAVYPLESPGGWHLIGACPVNLFNPDESLPNLLRAGDELQFRAVTEQEFQNIRQAVRAGETHGAELLGESS